MNTRLVIGDDHALMREGLRSLIQQEERMEVVGEADNGRDVLEVVRETNPHVIVMDVAMPMLNGIEATRHICTDHPNTRVIALSAHANKTFVREMLTAGAYAYVLKKRAYEELVHAVNEVMKGRKYLSPDIARGVIDDYIEVSASISENPAFVTLTDREREVLRQLAEGHSTRETADDLEISVKTVETHRRNLMEKLDLHSVAELTKFAIRSGMTSIDP